MQPRLIGFLCQRGAYAFYEFGDPLLRSLPRGFQALPVTHLQQIQSGEVTKAFRLGAEGVLLVGCEVCSAQHDTVTQHYQDLLRKLTELGITRERFQLEWCSAREPEKFSAMVATKLSDLRQLPPLRLPRILDETIVHCG